MKLLNYFSDEYIAANKEYLDFMIEDNTEFLKFAFWNSVVAYGLFYIAYFLFA